MHDIEGARDKRDQLRHELAGLQERVRSNPTNASRTRSSEGAAGTHERIRNVQAGIDRLDTEIADHEERRERGLAAARRPNSTEAGDGAAQAPFDVKRSPQGLSLGAVESPGEAKDAARRTIENYVRTGDIRSHAADTLDRLVTDPKDVMGLSARYIDAVGDPMYFSAFGKMFDDPQSGHMRMTPDESAAIARVDTVEKLRGLVAGTGASGGFALPIQIDPSIMLSSNGALNPIRQRARVISTPFNEWKGVSSAGVTASYDPEGSEVSDDSPTLAQPAIAAESGRAFIPFSIEIGQDWASLQSELLRLIADGRDTLDATKFYSGTGTDEPFGVQTGLAVAQRVLTAGVGAFALADVYALKQAIPARFYPNASWAWHPNRVDTIYRFVGGNSTEPPLMPERDGPLLGKPNDEWTALPTATATGTKIGLCGDFLAGYTIVDRIGMSVELIPHLFGGNGRPTGERGLFAYWRTGAKVVVPEALRYMEVQ